MSLLHKSLGEFVGTFALVFAGCGSIMIAERFPASIPIGVIPLVFGLTVAAMVYALGHISGAHFNPAVTVAFAVARHFPAKEVLAYCSAQILGGLAAISILAATLPEGQTFGATLSAVGIFSALVWEFILTFFLMFLIIAVATDTRAVGTMAGVAIGAAVAFCAYVGGPVTGASMNPARSFAPALFQHQMTTFWIYLMAPLAGAVSAALSYEGIRCQTEKNKNAKGCC
ncbi:MAG: aquaporin [Candidatus Omnitrophica bacterium]|nr:aquaporin [Candidatus Omnitrophota bacterium]